jgi:hypothetical protein
LVKILNNGTVKGLPVLRTLQNRNKEFNPAAFTVFGPKIIAMRGSFRDQALESRFFTEDMGGRPLRSDVPIQLPDSLKTEALVLRNKLLRFRMKNLFAIESDPARAVEGIDPRLNQAALSLLSLVDNGEVRQDIAETLRSRHAELAANRANSIERRTLAALDDLFAASDQTFVALTTVATRAGQRGMAGMLSPRAVGEILRAHSYPVWKSHGTMVVGRKIAAAD